jgi:CheY-like chemotaxis protein
MVSAPPNGRIRILVVDDEAMARRSLCQLLQMSGYFCAVAADGAQALELVQAFQPHAIILDLMMPVMDGYETARRLKDDAKTRAIPILALTASSTPEDRRQALRAGVDDFLTKPINLDELLLHLRHRLPRPGEEAATPEEGDCAACGSGHSL